MCPLVLPEMIPAFGIVGISLAEGRPPKFNLDIKIPQYAGEGNADPDELLADDQRQLADIQQTRDRLKAEVMEALQGSREGAKPRSLYPTAAHTVGGP